jgi:hypothetical protein
MPQGAGTADGLSPPASPLFRARDQGKTGAPGLFFEDSVHCGKIRICLMLNKWLA